MTWTSSQRRFLWLTAGWALPGVLSAAVQDSALVFLALLFWFVTLPLALAWLALGGYLVIRSIREARRATHPALALVMLAALPAAISVQWATAAALGGHPSDRRMLAEFQAHRSDFERLRAMFQEDRQLERVAPSFFRSTGGHAPDDVRGRDAVVEDRVAAYRALFSQLGLSSGIGGTADKQVIEFIRSTRGLSVSGSSKGFLYAAVPPEPVVPDLDHYRSVDDRSHTAYRHIDGHWYLYLSVEY